MMQEPTSSAEALFFYYLDKSKFLYFPDQWSPIFLDFSKNEVFALLFVYRKSHVNMTEVAEYMNIPLNTVTGVITRLEKKDLVKRERNSFDKRVVTIRLTENGFRFLKQQMEALTDCFEQLMDCLTDEEKETAIRIIDKVFAVLQGQGNPGAEKKEKPVKRIPIE